MADQAPFGLMPWVGEDADATAAQAAAEAAAARTRRSVISPPDQTNFRAAVSDLGLNPQEQALYQRHLLNLWGPGGVTNADGSRSTLFQSSGDIGGRIYNIPTVYDGKILPVDDAWARAEKNGINQFPSYSSDAEAEARYQKMHDYMERDTANYFTHMGVNRRAPIFGSLAPPRGDDTGLTSSKYDQFPISQNIEDRRSYDDTLYPALQNDDEFVLPRKKRMRSITASEFEAALRGDK